MVTVKNNTTYVISIAGQLIIAPLQIAEVDESTRGVAALIAEGALVPVVDAAAEAAKVQAEKDAWEHAQLDANALAAKEKAEAEAAEAKAKAEKEAAKALANEEAEAKAKSEADAAQAAEEKAKAEAEALAANSKEKTKRTTKEEA